MTFVVAADSYDRFMGRYSVPLAPQLADLAGIEAGQRAIDVGCGPGALTTELVHRLGPDHVAAVDPSEPFVAAAKERHPGVDVRLASAEQLPFGDDEFDAALAQLVVHFMADAVGGLREMARVTRPDGVVAASVWDMAGGRAPISLFWEAARDEDPRAIDESELAGVREGPSQEALRGGWAARGRGNDPLGRRRASELRGVVGAVHARRRAGRSSLRRSRPRAARRASRTVSRAPTRGPVRRDRQGMGGTRARRLTRP